MNPDKQTSKDYPETRLFWVVDSIRHEEANNEELFESLEDAEEYIKATKFNGLVRIRICVVRNAYWDEQLDDWNYDDLADTFSTVMSSFSDHWEYITKEQRSIS